MRDVGSWLAAKRKTSRQKEKDSKQKENLTAKRKRLTAKLLQYWEDISYFFCREVVVILFVVRLFSLPWGFSFCCEVNSFSVTVVGHRTFEILFPKILDFSICGYSWELAQTLLIWLAFKPYNSWTGPFRKTLDISVCQTSENKAFKMQHSVTVVRPLFAAKNENTI